jgi:hypothetical protein
LQNVFELLTVEGRLSVSYLEVDQINIGGPGTVTTGAAFTGGGFGVSGAIEGIAIAESSTS